MRMDSFCVVVCNKTKVSRLRIDGCEKSLFAASPGDPVLRKTKD